MQQQQRTRVKICGLTRIEDIDCAVRAGADAVGLVFYSKSPRALSLDQARELRRAVPAFVDVVALFVNASTDDVRSVIEHVTPDLLQFHGDESPAYCASFGHRYMRAFRLGAPGLTTPDEVAVQCEAYQDAAAWLYDSYSAGYGGSGKALDVTLLQKVLSMPGGRPIILSGGLTAQTVAASIRLVHPYAVDVSSGVESAPGCKSAEKIDAFIDAVHCESETNRGSSTC